MKKPSKRSAHIYLDVVCDLVRLPGGAFRVLLSFRDWANGGALSTHDDFSVEDQARDSVARAIMLFRLRRSPGRDQWRNAPSPGLRRTIGRVAGRLRSNRRQGMRDIYERIHWAAGEIVADASAARNLRAAIIEADNALRKSDAQLSASARACIETAIRHGASKPMKSKILRMRTLALRALLGALPNPASPRKRKR